MSWEPYAEQWAAALRAERDRSYVRNAPPFVELLPPPAGLALDLGCGEGRLTRDLRSRGYPIVGIDVSPSMVRLAAEADPGGDYRVGDAAALPFEDASADLVVAFMSIQDMEDPDAALAEAARVLAPGGRLCISTLHPIFSAGSFAGDGDDAPFALVRPYEALREIPSRRQARVPVFVHVRAVKP